MPKKHPAEKIESPDPSAGQVCLEFESKQEMIHCLDVVSELDGLGCEVVPWSLVIGPKALDTICEKRGIRARVVPLASSREKLSSEDRQRVFDAMLRAGKALEAASRGQ